MKNAVGFSVCLFALIVVLLSAAPARAVGELVCLDPGHGGGSGAYNATYNLWEDEINLDEAFRVKALLEGMGYSAVLTRENNDVSLSNNDRYTACNAASADILVSIHTNSSTNTGIDGTLTQYFHRDDKVLAQFLQDSMYSALSGIGWPFTNFGLERFASGVLLKSDMPAATVEPVMMSYNQEAALLETSIYLDSGVTPNPDCSNCRREQIAQSIASGIDAYLVATPGGGGEEGGGNGGGNCKNDHCKK